MIANGHAGLAQDRQPNHRINGHGQGKAAGQAHAHHPDPLAAALLMGLRCQGSQPFHHRTGGSGLEQMKLTRDAQPGHHAQTRLGPIAGIRPSQKNRRVDPKPRRGQPTAKTRHRRGEAKDLVNDDDGRPRLAQSQDRLGFSVVFQVPTRKIVNVSAQKCRHLFPHPPICRYER